MGFPKFTGLFIVVILLATHSYAQADTESKPSHTITEVPVKFLKQTNDKIDKYSNRITSKTEKTLTKLSKWENKIYELLLKTSPETADQLFGPGRETFSSMLQKLQQGKSLVENTKSQYNSYSDRLITNIKFIETQKEQLGEKYVQPLQSAKQKIKQLETDVTENESTQALIKERKKELIEVSIKYLRNTKYLKKINKETHYYVETIQNYKSIFEDESKLEKTVISLLKKIPGVEKFIAENSMLSSLFGNFSLSEGGGDAIPIVNGLAPRAQIMQIFQTSNASSTSNFNPFDKISQQMPDIKSAMNNMLNGNGTGDGQLPDFKPNSQKTKPFLKRLEYGFDLQFGKSGRFIPSTSNVGVQLGYKLNDKSSIGIGASYLLGLGNGWNNLKLSNEGLGLRTYVKILLKKNFSIQGGGEWNYNFQFEKLSNLRNSSNWQQNALIGVGKTVKASKKMKSDIKILYDFLANKHTPVTQPFIFRLGYHF